MAPLRLARRSDIPRLAQLDSGFTTEHSWQVSEERSSRAGQGEIRVVLRHVQLPRPRTVLSTCTAEYLEAGWDLYDLAIVAEHDEQPIGFLAACAGERVTELRYIVVDRPWRRQGVATDLLTGMHRWCHENDLRVALAAVSIKNDPAIALLQGQGYKVSGYNERHYGHGDVVLYLAYDLPDE